MIRFCGEAWGLISRPSLLKALIVKTPVDFLTIFCYYKWQAYGAKPSHLTTTYITWPNRLRTYISQKGLRSIFIDRIVDPRGPLHPAVVSLWPRMFLKDIGNGRFTFRWLGRFPTYTNYHAGSISHSRKFRQIDCRGLRTLMFTQDVSDQPGFEN